MLQWICLLLLALSHGLYLRPLVRAVLGIRLPGGIDFVGLSAIVYFDLGLLLEALGIRFRDPFFNPLWEASQTEIAIAVLLIASAPWLIRLGTSAFEQTDCEQRDLWLRDGHPRRVFFVLVTAIGIACPALPLTLLSMSPHLWESRALLGTMLGPFIVVLSLPMFLLAFYVRLGEASSPRGRLVVVVLLAASTVSTFAVGQRTLVLLPFVIVLLFGQRVSWRRWALVAAAGAIAAALLLPLFKSSFGAGEESPVSLVVSSLGSDFHRSPELVRAVGMSSVIGTRTVRYAGAGYVYATFFFVPRVLAPFKGDSTARDFTAVITQSAPETLEWGFGISAISEALLNFGIVLTPLVLLGYGVALGWLQQKSQRWTSLQIPVCLGSLWLFGYHLPALLLNFGAMAAVGLLCEKCFAERSGLAVAGTSCDPGKM